jgi:hypothetical protein
MRYAGKERTFQGAEPSWGTSIRYLSAISDETPPDFAAPKRAAFFCRGRSVGGGSALVRLFPWSDARARHEQGRQETPDLTMNELFHNAVGLPPGDTTLSRRGSPREGPEGAVRRLDLR